MISKNPGWALLALSMLLFQARADDDAWDFLKRRELNEDPRYENYDQILERR